MFRNLVEEEGIREVGGGFEDFISAVEVEF